MPIEITRLSSNTGRQVTPLFMDFQMPPPAVATKSVLDGPGIPTMSDERPSKFAGPRLRHRMPATVAESIVCAWTATPDKTIAAPTNAERKRLRCMALADDGGRQCCCGDSLSTTPSIIALSRSWSDIRSEERRVGKECR